MITVNLFNNNDNRNDSSSKNEKIISFLIKMVQEMLIDPETWFENFAKKAVIWAEEGLLVCPCCGGSAFVPHGSYHRHILIEMSLTLVVIRRIRCTNEKCRRTHAVMPLFIVPRSTILISDILHILKTKGQLVEIQTISTHAEFHEDAERMIMKKYHTGWIDLLKEHKIAIDENVCKNCIKLTGYQFFQGFWSSNDHRFKVGYASITCKSAV